MDNMLTMGQLFLIVYQNRACR